MSKSQDRLNALAEEVASRLIEQLEKGTAPWQKPWNGVTSRPHNPITASQYSGANWLCLQMAAEMQGFSDPRWMTFKQITDAGGHVKKGSRGVPCLYWADKWLDAEGKPLSAKEVRELPPESRQRILIPCRFVVFNAEQTEGLNLPEWKAPEVTWDPNERAEKILKASNAVIHHKLGNAAFYSPSTDSITLPERGQFANASDYYDTALHELGHWTGHESRLNRDLSGRFGTPDYAKEELRAEIASMMLASEIGLPHNTQQHAAYVASWIKILKEDPAEIIRASADAQKITDFVKNLEQERYYVVDYEKNAVLRLTHPEWVAGVRKVLNDKTKALAKFESFLVLVQGNTLSPEHLERNACNALLNPTDPRSQILLPITLHRGAVATSDPHHFIGLAKLQPGLEDKAFRFLQRIDGNDVADKARADWAQEEARNSTTALAFGLNSHNYWKALEIITAKEKTPLETAAEKFPAAAPEEQKLVAREALATVKAEKRFYLIDFEANDASVVTHRELMAKAGAILQENPGAKQEFEEAFVTETKAGKIVRNSDPNRKERQVLRCLLDPTLPWSNLEKCPVNHAGLFYTDNPLRAVAAASFYSPDLAQKATALVARVDSGITVDDVHRQLQDPEIAESLTPQRLCAERYWKTLESERTKAAFPKSIETLEPSSSGKKFYVLDFERNGVQRLTHAEYMQKARDILEKNPRAKAEFESAWGIALQRGKMTQERERNLVGMVLDPADAWSFLHGVYADHQGLFVTDRPALAVQVAKLKSDDFGNLVFKEAAKASRGFSLQTLQVESIQPKFLGEMSTIRLHCGKHWAILAEKRRLRGSLEANYLQEPLREKLERLPQSDRDEFKQMAVAAICQEDKERYERNNTYYAVDFKTRMVHRWSHEQVMRQGLYIIRDNPKALARFEMEKKEAVLKDGTSPEKAEASALRERVSPASKDWMVGIDRGHPGFFFSKDPAESMAAAAKVSPDIARRIEMRVRLAEGETAASLAKVRATALEKSPAFQANWAIQPSPGKAAEVDLKNTAAEPQRPRTLER